MTRKEHSPTRRRVAANMQEQRDEGEFRGSPKRKRKRGTSKKAKRGEERGDAPVLRSSPGEPALTGGAEGKKKNRAVRGKTVAHEIKNFKETGKQVER